MGEEEAGEVQKRLLLGTPINEFIIYYNKTYNNYLILSVVRCVVVVFLRAV